MVLDGTIAQDTTQIAGIWGIREGISVALKHAGDPPHAHVVPVPENSSIFHVHACLDPCHRDAFCALLAHSTALQQHARAESYRTEVSGRLPIKCPLGSSGFSLSPSIMQVLSLPQGRLAQSIQTPCVTA